MNQQTPVIPFDRLPEEPAADFATLLAHRDAGPCCRSLRLTAEVVGRSESALRRLASRWNWHQRLEVFDEAVLLQLAATGCSAQERHREQLLAFRDAHHRRADQLARTAEQMLELVVESVRAHIAAGSLMQPGQLGAALSAAARALEAAGSTAGTALGVDEILEHLLKD